MPTQELEYESVVNSLGDDKQKKGDMAFSGASDSNSSSTTSLREEL